MAAWQFHFSLIPSVSIARHHGTDAVCLPAYVSMLNKGLPEVETEFIDYWAGVDMTVPPIQALKALLPPMESWSETAEMFGTHKGDRIEIWNDDIRIDIDVTDLKPDLLRAIVAIAAELDCKIVSKDDGKPIAPDLPLVVDALFNSRAMQFARDPEGFIEAIARENSAD